MSIVVRNMTKEDFEKLKAEHKALCPDLEVSELIKDSIEKYVEHRIEPGSFLMAVLENDLMLAMGNADSYNRASLFQICQYVMKNVPRHIRGNRSSVANWLSGHLK